MRIVGIDPGLSGAWAYVVDGRAVQCGDMPVAGEGAQRCVSAAVLADRLAVTCHPELVVVEIASAMPANLRGREQGNASTFRFGVAYGMALAAPAILGIPVEKVSPVTWKRHFRLIGTDKEASRGKALELAPNLASMLDRVRDHNRAEAVLIGLYAAATWGTRAEKAAA